MKTLALILISVAASFAQGGPAFEVASIKPISSGSGGNNVEVTPGALLVHAATIATCIRWAWGVSYSQIAGADPNGQDVLNSGRFDIVAKPAGQVPESQLRLMLRTLLADRFKLALHHETREMQTYALVVDKKEPRFRESEGEGASQMQAKSKLTRQYKWTTMTQFADDLSDAMRSPVVDRTGLSAKYDFAIDLSPYMDTAGEQRNLDLPGMVTTAIREQLGLRLTSQRVPVDVLVIDHLEKPSPN